MVWNLLGGRAIPWDEPSHGAGSSDAPWQSYAKRGYAASGYRSRAEERTAARRTSSPSGRYLEHDHTHDTDAGSWVGRQVRHPKLGVGRIQHVSEGEPMKVTVLFASAGIKTIVASFLEPA